MASQDLLAFLMKAYRTFRATVWFRATYLVLLGFIVGLLYLLSLSGLGCLVLLLMPVTAFLVPYWLGERRMSRFAANALLVFGVAILVAGAVSTQEILSSEEPDPLQSLDVPSNGNMTLSNGTVTPYRAMAGTSFTFVVRLTTVANGAPGDFDVSLNLTVIEGTSFRDESFPLAYRPGPDSDPDTINGTWYETNVTLDASIYGYGFSATDGRNWTYTSAIVGPVTASWTTFYGFFVYVATFHLTIQFLIIPFYFAILFLWWYARRAREMRTRMVRASKEKEEQKPEVRPTEPMGKVAKAAAFTCTNCAADVSASDDKCPKCGAVFED